MGLSAYSANRIFNFTLDGIDVARPTDLYAGLLNGGTEVSGTGYARQDIGVDFNGDMLFGPATSNWSTSVNRWGIWDAETGGNLLFSGYINGSSSTRSTSAGTSLHIPADALTVNYTGMSPLLPIDIGRVLGTQTDRDVTTRGNLYVDLATSLDVIPSTNGYVKQSVTFTGSGNSRSNSNTLTFPVCTGTWGTIDRALIRSYDSGGETLFKVVFDRDLVTEANDQIIIEPGDLELRLSTVG